MKKRLERILTILLASAMLCTGLPANALQAAEVTSETEEVQERPDTDINTDADAGQENTEENNTSDSSTGNLENGTASDNGQQEDPVSTDEQNTDEIQES